MATPAIRNLIREAKVAQMYSMIQTGSAMGGMQTMEQSVKMLVAQGGIVESEEGAPCRRQYLRITCQY